jgi:hypothetical protein
MTHQLPRSARPARWFISSAAFLAGALVLGSCESLPGEKRTQGAVIGGVGGAAAGALASEDDRVLGAVIGAALGAGGGYLIGRELEDDEAPPQDPQASTITEQDVQRATTADIDGDGNVTMAELVAMESAGLSDDEIIDRLEDTDAVFKLTDEQRNTLRERGISSNVIARLETVNRDNELLGTPPRG